jgi:hypothetical protein
MRASPSPALRATSPVEGEVLYLPLPCVGESWGEGDFLRALRVTLSRAFARPPIEGEVLYLPLPCVGEGWGEGASLREARAHPFPRFRATSAAQGCANAADAGMRGAAPVEGEVLVPC